MTFTEFYDEINAALVKRNTCKLLTGSTSAFSFHVVLLLLNGFHHFPSSRRFLNDLEFFPCGPINKSAYINFKLEYLLINLTRPKKCILDSHSQPSENLLMKCTEKKMYKGTLSCVTNL